MARRISTDVRRHVKWSQKGACLLCSYSTGHHMHHVIPKSKGGPDHHLNLVALCPNHHALVEKLKRHALSQTGGATYESSNHNWLRQVKGAIASIQELDSSVYPILALLSTPCYCVDRDAVERVRRGDQHAAGIVKSIDVELLTRVNRYRPRIHLRPREMTRHFAKIEKVFSKLGAPYDKRIQHSIDNLAKKVEKKSPGRIRRTCEYVAECHVLNLRLGA